MAAAFPKPRSPTPNPSDCWACANGPLCWEAKSLSKASRTRRPRCASPFPWSGPDPLNHVIMRILIADDHAVVRHGLKQILADEFKRADFGEARTGQEALNRVWKEK